MRALAALAAVMLCLEGATAAFLRPSGLMAASGRSLRRTCCGESPCKHFKLLSPLDPRIQTVTYTGRVVQPTGLERRSRSLEALTSGSLFPYIPKSSRDIAIIS